MTRAGQPLAKRFWLKVQTSDGCWAWRGHKSEDGYGLLRIDGRKGYAHRLSWQLHNGPIPEGLKVLHHCDNPPCVKPDHLFLGTQTDNILDMDRKGRRRPATGEAHGRAKLTESDVREIRRAYATGGTSYPKLAQQYGVAFSLIAAIVKGRLWRQVDS